MKMPPPVLLRRAGIALGLATALAITALAHHPVIGHAHSSHDTLSQIAALGDEAGLVHGLLIAIYAVIAAALAVFSSLLGMRRPWVITASASYALAFILVTGAMLLDGFVVPALASGSSVQEAAMVHGVIGAIGTIIQVLTKAGLLAMSLAMLAWSLALLASAHLNNRARAAAAPGLLAALVTAGVIVFSGVRLAPVSLMYLFAMQALWYAAVSAVLLAASARVTAVLTQNDSGQAALSH